MYIVADIGGTKMRIAATRDCASFETPVKLDTPQNYEEGIALICKHAQEMAGQDGIQAFAIGIAGSLSNDKRRLVSAAHLPLWVGHDLASDLEKALSTSVHLENDTAQVGLGEAVFGAGKGAPVVMYMTVSTGVNAVRLIEGAIDRGQAEMGGQYLDTSDTPASLEELISGNAITKKYGVRPYEIAKDSPLWEDLARITAVGVHNSILHWSPDRVVLGGSMFNEIGIPVDRVEAHVQQLMRKFPAVPEIVHSSLKDEGGLWGGLAVLKSQAK